MCYIRRNSNWPATTLNVTLLCYKLIGFAILSLALTQLEFIQADDSGCMNNFSPVGDKCLMLLNTYNTWYVADRHCRSLGAELLSFQNETQLQQIDKWMEIGAPQINEFWTSGNCLGDKGNFYWQSTGEWAKYLPWSTSRPQINIGDCLIVNLSKSTIVGYPAVSIMSCINHNTFICEQEPQKYNTRICLKSGSYENA